MDLDLEADLGVDTVKQAEIFAAIREHFGVARDDTLNLRDFPTLTHVIGWIRDKTADKHRRQDRHRRRASRHICGSHHRSTSQDHCDRRHFGHRPDHRARCRYRRCGRISRTCVPTGVTLGAGTRVAVMRDQGGVADALITRLTQLGVDVLAMRPDDDIDTVLDGVSIDGVYWLAALDDEGPLDDLDVAGWREALRRRVRNLYTTMRRLVRPPAFPGRRHQAGRIPRLRRGRRDLPAGRRGHRVRQGLPTRAGRRAGQGRRLPGQPEDRGAGRCAGRRDPGRSRLCRSRPCRRPPLGRRPGGTTLPGDDWRHPGRPGRPR